MNRNEISNLAQGLNTSTSEWLRAYSAVTNEYVEPTLGEVEDFLRLAAEKRDQAQALVELLCDEEDRIRLAAMILS